MSKNYAIIIQFVLPLTTFYRSGAQRNNVYKQDAFVTSWRSHNRAWQSRRHDRLSETSGILWIHRGALTNQRCSLATGCGINHSTSTSYHMCTADHAIMLATALLVQTRYRAISKHYKMCGWGSGAHRATKSPIRQWWWGKFHPASSIATGSNNLPMLSLIDEWGCDVWMLIHTLIKL